jgi:Tol biopolymer transport system component/tRNA A-37 threonylcarbamoyl transferase component Bud32
MSDLERLKAALAGRYTIDKEIGAGGMATVYLAEDARHHRKVAVKVLRPELSASLGAQRFHREIEVAAGLQHPHILPLLDSGEADGFLYFVMPYVDGESLRERLSKHGELPVHEAVRILIEVVDALAHAHSRGVVHRDIKPDNIMLSGRHALVTDFGVAKAVSEATGRHTLTSVGIALGTPSYMAPEQATADPHIDHRVDIYAVGCLAYELLSGHPPFAGRSPQEILAAHVTQNPDAVSKMRPTISAPLNDVVMKCLTKRPADRYQTAEQLLGELEPLMTPTAGITPAQTRPTPAVAPSVASPTRKRAFWFAAGALVLAATAFATTMLPGRGPTFALGRAQPIAFESALELEPAISPDGRHVAYSSGPLTRMRIYVRQLGSRAVPVTTDSGDSQRRPLWSPDGSQLLFIQGGDIVVVPALGGLPRMIVKGAMPFWLVSAAWSPDGKEIAYVAQDSLMVKPLDGGAARVLRTPGQFSGLAWSPDGRWIAYVFGDPRFTTGVRDFGNIAPSQIRMTRADGSLPETRALTDDRSLNVSPAWLPDSKSILFVSNRDGPRDVYSTSVSGSGHIERAPLRVTSGLNPHTISVSKDGSRIAYSAFIGRSNIWGVTLKPGRVATMADARQITTGNQLIEAPDLTPDGKNLIYDSDREGSVDVYRISINGGEPQRITTDPAAEFNPSESPDGKWVVFHGFKYGQRDIFVIPRDGGEMIRVTSDSTHEQLPMWSPSGNAITFFRYGHGMRPSTQLVRRRADGGWGPMEPIDNFGSALWYNDTTLFVFRGDTLALQSIDNNPVGTYMALPRGRFDRFRSLLDGRLMLSSFDADGHTSYWLVARPHATPVLVARLTDPMRPIFRYEFDTDGRVIYVTIADRQSDVFVAELARR